MNVSDEDINQISYHKKCDTVLVLVVRHFLERVEPFFETIILNGTLGKTNYFAILVEFQVRGSPHVHSFIWILNLPKLTKSNIEEYTHWIDSIIHTNLPDPCSEPDLLELAKTYQIHQDSKHCYKYRNLKRRFHFGKTELSLHNPFLILYKLIEKNEIMENGKLLLKNVRLNIDTEVNFQKNFYNRSRDDYEEIKSIDKIMEVFEFLSLILSKHCQFLMIKIIENQPTRLL